MRETPAPWLAPRTTLRVGGTALAEIVLERLEDVPLLGERLRALGGTPLVLGAGSNILAQDGELPLVLVRPQLTHGPEIVGEAGGKVLVRAGAGVPLPRLLRFCAVHGLSGLEGLVGKVPGLLEVHVNINGLPSSNADLMLDTTFTDEAALKGYAVHPAHVAVADGKVRPYTAVRTCLDFTV